MDTGEQQLGKQGYIQQDAIRGVDPLRRATEMLVARMAEYATGTETVVGGRKAQERIIGLMEAIDIMTYASHGANYSEEELALAELWRLGEPNYRARIISQAASNNSEVKSISDKLDYLNDPHTRRMGI